MPKTVVTNSSDEAQIRAAEAYEKEVGKDLAGILKTAPGRRWLHALIFDVCHVERLSIVPGASDSTEFNEGGRAVGLKLLEEIKQDHFAEYLLMLKESHDA